MSRGPWISSTLDRTVPLRRADAMVGATSSAPAVRKVPMRSGVCSTAVLTAATPSSNVASTACAVSRKTSPAMVSVVPRAPRATRAVPRCDSSAVRWCVTVGWLKWRCRAAAASDPSVAMARSTTSWRRSSIHRAYGAALGICAVPPARVLVDTSITRPAQVSVWRIPIVGGEL